MGTALLQSQQLLGTEGLVVDLRGSLDKVLEVGSEQEVTEVDELAVSLVLNVDNTPSVLTATDLLSVDNDRLLRADNGEGNEALCLVNTVSRWHAMINIHLDLAVEGTLLVIKLLVVVREHLEVVERELLLDALLELLALLRGQGIGLGNDGHDIDHVRKLLQDDNINGLEGVTGGLDEEKARVDAGILDVSLSLRGEFLPQVRRVLILDVLDNGVPAAVIVDQVAVARGVDDVESQTNAVLLDNVGDRLDLGGRADGLIGLHATLGVDEVRGKDGVDQSRLAKTSLA